VQFTRANSFVQSVKVGECFCIYLLLPRAGLSKYGKSTCHKGGRLTTGLGKADSSHFSRKCNNVGSQGRTGKEKGATAGAERGERQAEERKGAEGCGGGGEPGAAGHRRRQEGARRDAQLIGGGSSF
jgi:hypothetical protein